MRGPALSTVAAVKSPHETIRRALGVDCDTFLQGSYKNDAVLNLNDAGRRPASLARSL
jgi:hypothetical protein